MASSYTRGDSFSSGASREHIERALVDYGATGVLFSQRGNRSAIAFRGEGRQFRIVLSLPRPDGPLPIPGDTAEGPAHEAKEKALELATRRYWRALALAIDAKLGAAAAGIGTLQSEFLAHVVLPGNLTVLDELEPIIASAYRSGRHPSFGDSAASSLPAAPPRAPAEPPNLRAVVAPEALGRPEQPQRLRELSAQGVGRILHSMVQILGHHGSLSRVQMLEIMEHELRLEQPRRGSGGTP